EEFLCLQPRGEEACVYPVLLPIALILVIKAHLITRNAFRPTISHVMALTCQKPCSKGSRRSLPKRWRYVAENGISPRKCPHFRRRSHPRCAAVDDRRCSSRRRHRL